MPSRTVTDKDAEAQDAPKPARAARAKKEETTAPPAETATAPAKEEKAGTVKKFLLTEKVKKYLGEIAPDSVQHIHEVEERIVQDEENYKNNVCFITFSDDPKQEATNDEFNVGIIKDVLFGFHTTPEKHKTGKAMYVEVIPATDDAPHILIVQEVGADK